MLVALRFQRRLRAIALVLAVGGAGLGMADTTNAETLALADESMMFGEVPSVFSVSRFDENPAEAPGSVTVITHEMIRQFGYRNLAEVLRGVNGFTVSNDLSYSYVGLRGAARPGDYNARVLVMVDGHRINDALYDGALVGNEGPVDLSAVERIEITRGPGSSVYGTNAMLAVINLVTREAASIEGAHGSISTDSLGLFGANLLAGGAIGTVDAVLQVSSAKRSGRRTIDFGNSSAYEPSEWSAHGLDDERFNRALLKLSTRGLTVSLGHGSRKKAIPSASYETEYDTPGTSVSDMRNWVSFGGFWKTGERGELRARVALDEYRYVGRYVYRDASSGDLYTNHDDGSAQWYTSELSWLWRGAAHTIVTGIDYLKRVSMKQHNEDIFVNLDVNHHGSSVGAFAQDTWKISEPLSLTVGVRRDNHRYGQAWSATSPRAALVWHPAERDVIKLLYGSAYRVPNSYERYYGDGGKTQKGNPDLGPEHVSTTELSWEHEFDKSLSISTALFAVKARDVIDQVVDPFDGLMVYDNSAVVSSRGIELEIAKRAADGTRVQFGTTYSSVRQSPDALPRTAPQLAAHFKFAFPVPALASMLALEWRYLSNRENARRENIGNSSQIDLVLSSPAEQGKWRWTAAIHNLLGKRIGDPVGTEIRPKFAPQEGRVFALQIEYAM